MSSSEAPARARRGWQGAVLKAMRAKDYRLRVVATEDVGPYYRRLRMSCPELLADRPHPHPTLWLRLWFPVAGGVHQRAYTVIDADAAAGELTLELALHGGPACRWGAAAAVGDEIEATLLGSRFVLPDPEPRHWLLVGDTASLPAINALLDDLGDLPVDVVLEHQRPAERELPVRARPGTTVAWVPREDDGALLRDRAVLAARATIEAGGTDGFAAWVAADTRTTRALVSELRGLGLDKAHVIAQGYWVP